MNEYTTRISRTIFHRVRRAIFRERAPDMNFITGSRELSRDEFRVIADAAFFRRIFAGDDMPAS
jgi:hypothetical protein